MLSRFGGNSELGIRGDKHGSRLEWWSQVSVCEHAAISVAMCERNGAVSSAKVTDCCERNVRKMRRPEVASAASSTRI